MVPLLFLLMLARGAPGKHGAEQTSKRRTKGNMTLRAYADGFIRLTSPEVDFYLPPRQRTMGDAVEVARGNTVQIAAAIEFAKRNFE